jgi:hypothetical protein
MIIKVLEQLIKTVNNGENEFPQEIPIGIAVKKMNITEITELLMVNG